jgi:ABC-type multidrug transport system fused ATPase/permease subunit
LIETFWATLAQVAATMISIFAGFLGVIMVYLKEKKDAVDAEIRNKKLEIADLLSALVSEHVEGSVSFFAGNYDARALHEATSGMIKLLVGPTPTEEQIPEIGKRLIESFHNLGKLLPSKTWELLSSRFTGIDTRIADLSEKEFAQWSRQMYDYVTELEFIKNFGKERLTEIIEQWEASWEGARFFLSKDGIERFFGTFSQVKESLFQIRRLRNIKNAHTFSSVLPLWPLTILGLLFSFIVAVWVPLISILNGSDGSIATIVLAFFASSAIVAMIPFLALAAKGKTLTPRAALGYGRHITNVLHLKWVSHFGSVPAVGSPRQLFVECRNPECRKEFFSGMTIASTERNYSGHNFDNNQHGCPYCGEAAVYSWKDYHFR